MPTPVAILEQLGLTALEAEIYVYLVHSSPATGYGIAKALGKATANTYKAIESLLAKGVILGDDAKVRQYRAVPHTDVLSTLEDRHRNLREQAADALKSLERSWNDDRMYQVATVEQVIQGYRRMLKSAKRVALFDVFPKPLAIIGADLERAARRGVEVYVKVYAPIKLKGIECIVHPRPDAVIKRWPGHWVNGVVDGREHQIAFLSPDMQRVYQAVWSASAYLSWVYHHGIASEYVQTVVGSAIEAGKSTQQIAPLFAKFARLATIDAPGYDALMRRFRNGDEESDRHSSKVKR